MDVVVLGAEKCFGNFLGCNNFRNAGGETNNPTYYEVCSGLTGHSEVVRVIWNKREIDVSDLLKCFGNVMTLLKKTGKMIWVRNIDQQYITKIKKY